MTRFGKPILLFIMVATLTIISFNTRDRAPQSDVYIPNPEMQLGPLLLNEVRSLQIPSAEASFQIVNSSNESRSIRFEGASCGCTNAEIDGNPLQIQDRFTLAADGSACFKLKSRLSGKPGLSDFRANLTAFASDGTQTEMSVHYSLKVLADIVVTPDVLLHEFHSLDDVDITKTIHIERRWRGSQVPSSLPTLEHLPPQLRIRRIVEDKPLAQIEPNIWSRSWAISVSLCPSSNLQSNPVRSLIPITFAVTDDFDPVSLDLPVLIRLASGIEAPDFIHFGFVQLGEKQTRRILIRAADNAEFFVLNGRSSSSAFSVSKPPSTPSRSCWLELTFQPKERGNQLANVVIETDHPRTRQLKITVRGTGSATETKISDKREALHQNF